MLNAPTRLLFSSAKFGHSKIVGRFIEPNADLNYHQALLKLNKRCANKQVNEMRRWTLIYFSSSFDFF